MATFLVEADSQNLRVSDRQKGGVSFTVTNRLDRGLSGKAEVRTEDADAKGWITLSGEAVRSFAPEGTHRFDVAVALPDGHEILAEDPQDPAARAVAFHIVVADMEDPDEFTDSATITFWVRRGEKKGVPWWVFLIIGLVVAAGAGVGIYFAVTAGGGLGEECKEPTDCDKGLICATAAASPTCQGPLGYAPCTEDAHCQTGYCEKQPEATEGTCAPLPLRKLGEACGEELPPCEGELACGAKAGVCQGQEDFVGCTAAGDCLTGLCRDGTCTLAAVGEACGETVFCAYPLVCREDSCKGPNGFDGCSAPAHCESGFCNVGSCGAAPTLGQACSPGSGCERPLRCHEGVCRGANGYKPCDSPDDCTSGFCDLGLANGTCGNPPAAGRPCHPDSGCKEGLLCWERVCRGDVGSSCRANQDCISQVCDGRHCQPPPGLGSTCDPNGGRCAFGLLCTTGPGGHRCRGDKGFRGCTKSEQCVTGACWNGSCIDPPGLRRPCAEAGACQSGLVCYDGRCVGPNGFGPCNSHSQCETLYCKSRVCRKPGLKKTCNPAPNVGCESPYQCPAAKKRCMAPLNARCNGNDDCLEGSCIDEKCTRLQICRFPARWVNGKCVLRPEVIKVIDRMPTPIVVPGPIVTPRGRIPIQPQP